MGVKCTHKDREVNDTLQYAVSAINRQYVHETADQNTMYCLCDNISVVEKHFLFYLTQYVYSVVFGSGFMHVVIELLVLIRIFKYSTLFDC